MKPLQWVDRAGVTIQALETSIVIREQLSQCIDAMEEATSSSPLNYVSPLNQQHQYVSPLNQQHQYLPYSIDEINRFVFGRTEMKNDSHACAHHHGIDDYDPDVTFKYGCVDTIQAVNAYSHTALYAREDVNTSSSYEIADLLDGIVRSKTSLQQRQSRQLWSNDHPTRHAYRLQHSLADYSGDDKSNVSLHSQQHHRSQHALNTVADCISVVDDVILSYRNTATSNEEVHAMSEGKIVFGKCYSDTMTHDLIKLHRLQLQHQESVLKPNSRSNPTIPTNIITPSLLKHNNTTTTTPTTAKVTGTIHDLLSSFISTNLSNTTNTMHDDHHYVQVSGSSDLLTIHACSDVHPATNHITIHTRVYNSSGFKIPSFQLHLLVSCNLLNTDHSTRAYGLNNNHDINTDDENEKDDDDGYDDDDSCNYHISSVGRRFRKILFDQSIIFDAQSISIATGLIIYM